MLALLILALGCTGAQDADCAGLSAGPERDGCYAERAERLVQEDPEAALEAARAVENPATRDLVLVKVLTEPGTFRDDVIRASCEAELSSAAHKDQCRRYLERPHLRVEAQPGAPGPGGGAPSLPPGTDCATATGEAADYCAYNEALGMQGRSVGELRAVLEGIESADIRGQAVAGVLRQRMAVGNMEQLRELAGLLELTESGRWRAESASLLGSELPFRVLQGCQGSRGPEACATLEKEEVLPFALETCAGAEALLGQCFDHICMNAVNGALDQGMTEGPAALAARVQARHAELVAVDARVEAMPGCHAIWLGRKLVQRAKSDLEWADERCAAMGEDARYCYSGLAEEHLTLWLRGHDVASQEALVEQVIGSPQDFGQPPEAVAAYLPCGALSVLTGELSPKLAGARPGPELVKRLAEAQPGCAWK
ncbi:MAG: hypothetical protein H6741_05495 [Alphaproteobacteria bacterium]|nr:hypothetical protein [Alphaproteobacteria bacterium]MCB9792161.1 hypothetical protein [Alphaproteobacteria bacterium]